MKKKPLIGVTTSTRKDRLMWLCIKLGVQLSGGKAVRITPLQSGNFRKCDGFVISGGVDIDPSCYGEENIASVNVEPERDELEQSVINCALESEKPLLGICRGAQMINIVSGGTLYQEAKDFNESFMPTESLIGKILTRRRIEISRPSHLYRLSGNKDKLYVNSLHHQAIKKLGENLKVVAKDDTGMIQAIESRNQAKHLILGVQWHPEFMLYQEAQRKLFKILIRSA